MCVFINHGIWSCQFPLWNCRSHLPPDGQRMTTLAGTNPSSTLCDPAVPSLQSHSCVPPGALQVLLHLSGLLLDACERGQTSTARSHTRHSFQKSPRSVSLCPPQAWPPVAPAVVMQHLSTVINTRGGSIEREEIFIFTHSFWNYHL